MPRVGETLAVEAFHWSLPLEDIADPNRPQPPLRALAAVHPDIAEFMRCPQVGARRVAKTMLETAHPSAWDSSLWHCPTRLTAVAGIVVFRDPAPAIQQLATPVGHGQAPTQRHLTLVRSDDHRPAPEPAAESTAR